MSDAEKVELSPEEVALHPWSLSFDIITRIDGPWLNVESWSEDDASFVVAAVNAVKSAGGLTRLQKYEAVVRAAKEVGKMWPGRRVRSNYSVAVIELLQALDALQEEAPVDAVPQCNAHDVGVDGICTGCGATLLEPKGEKIAP